MTWDAILAQMDELQVPSYLRTTIQFLFDAGDLPTLTAVLNCHAEDHAESGCRTLAPEDLVQAPAADPEPWAVDAARRIILLLHDSPSDALPFNLARHLEEAFERRDRERAIESQGRLFDPPEGDL